MNCTQAHAHLPALLYADLPPAEAARVQDHLASCAACQKTFAELQSVRQLLDEAPIPAVQVNLGRLYHEVAVRQERRAKRWRRVAVAGFLSAAASLLIVIGLRLEIRTDTPSAPLTTHHSPLTVTAEQFKLATDLIHALAADIERRDEDQQLRMMRLQTRLENLQRQTAEWRQESENGVAALYTAQFSSNTKGEKE